MNYYQITLCYKGTHYLGWQNQITPLKTIQGTLEFALKNICHSDQVKSIGSGRTDAGVHALAQEVKIEIPLEISCIGLQKALNSHLPQDIRVLNVVTCSAQFNPTYDAVWKEYVYLFSLEEIVNPFGGDLMVFHPYKLDIELMQKACALFIGKHDFINFQCVGTEVKSTVREIFHCRLTAEKNTSSFLSQIIPAHFMFEVRGSGFLKQMVRLMVGSLWAVGQGKLSLEELQKHLKEKQDKRPGIVAPPHGLYLKKVNYS